MCFNDHIWLFVEKLTTKGHHMVVEVIYKWLLNDVVAKMVKKIRGMHPAKCSGDKMKVGC